jgi:hypothetical protein
MSAAALPAATSAAQIQRVATTAVIRVTVRRAWRSRLRLACK